MLAVSRQFWATPLPRREERILTFLSPESLGLRLPLLFACRPRLVFSQSRGGHKVSPSISSVRAPSIAASNSPLIGEAGCPLKRSVSVFPPQNGSGSPAQRPCTVARNSISNDVGGVKAILG